MKRAAMLGLAGLFCLGLLVSCGHAVTEEDERYYSKVENILVDFSKKIKGYYGGRSLPIPQDFNEEKFLELLEEVYPDQSKVQLIKDDFKIKVRWINGNYAVMLCDPRTRKKILEDLSCHLNRVEIRHWDKPKPCPCTFEENWEEYCK